MFGRFVRRLHATASFDALSMAGWPTCLGVLVVVVALGAGGCERRFMPTPNVFVAGQPGTRALEVPEDQRTNTVELIYITDRKRVGEPGDDVAYGWKRTNSLVLGRCVVEIGRDLDWPTLADQATRRKRSKRLPVRVCAIEEMVRLPETPFPLVRRDGTLIPDPAAVAARDASTEVVAARVRDWIGADGSQDVVLYVHGYRSDFEDAACVLGSLAFWYRGCVPILYTWPAGAPGLLTGYVRDRESGEFTVFHLKNTLRELARIPEIDRIHIVAHSRGTDVAVSALREMLLEERGAGRRLSVALGLGTIVLAAPDIDMDIMRQRIVAERMHETAERLVVYVSAHDKAIGAAEWLTRSSGRLGRVKPSDADAAIRRRMSLLDSVEVVDVRVPTGMHGHSYFHESPAVSSDLLLLLMDGARAGSAARPLRAVFPGYWILDDPAYPFGAAPEADGDQDDAAPRSTK